ncbi:hypothetical protein ID866_9729 [Astraeus odoratus]|nr:hypothetical protein ID866_9729 [Astraeus odoratus]
MVLVDTPGFDDPNLDDTQMFAMVSKWLQRTYNGKPFLSAILYFHPITDTRLRWMRPKIFQLLQKTCKLETMTQVFLVTTMWDEVDEVTGDKRIAALRGKHWKTMIAKGSTLLTYQDNTLSAGQLLKNVIDIVTKQCDDRLQQEISGLKNELQEVAPGQDLYQRLNRLAAERLEVLERLKTASGDTFDATTAEELRKEYDRVKAELTATLRQSQGIVLPRLRRRAVPNLLRKLRGAVKPR